MTRNVLQKSVSIIYLLFAIYLPYIFCQPGAACLQQHKRISNDQWFLKGIYLLISLKSNKFTMLFQKIFIIFQNSFLYHNILYSPFFALKYLYSHIPVIFISSETRSLFRHLGTNKHN